jgi:hypothetical protein
VGVLLFAEYRTEAFFNLCEEGIHDFGISKGEIPRTRKID